jgi:MoaA/NifB/PqqE/SkfB family radical SAM enzyme
MDLSVLDALWSKSIDRPFNLEFAVTRKCNSKCLMCNQWKLTSNNELSSYEISRIFLSYQHFKMVGITGGEPTLREDLSKIILKIVQTQYQLKRLFITSNGFLPEKLYSDVYSVLEYLNTNRMWRRNLKITVLVSIDGYRDLHNKIRGVEHAYDKAIENLEKLAPLQLEYPFFHLGSVSTYGAFNYKEYDAVLDELRKLRTKYMLEPAFCFVWHGNLYDQLEAPNVDFGYLKAVETDRHKIIKFLQEKRGSLLDARSFFWRFSKNFAQNPKKQVIPCEASKIRYYLDPYGKVYPCIIWNHLIGDLRENGYNFPCLFNAPMKQFARNLIKRGKCPNCYLTCEFIPTMMAHPFSVGWNYLQDVMK